jgi:hypothetical protein
MFLFECNRETHLVRNGADMMKAAGISTGTDRSFVMVDESNQFIGAGDSGASLMKSIGVVEALRNSKPLAESVLHKSTHINKPLRKSFGKSPFAQLTRELDQLKRDLRTI